MQRVAIFIPEDQIRKLKSIARGRPYAEVVREAIAMYIRAYWREEDNT